MVPFVVATANADKAREIGEILSGELGALTLREVTAAGATVAFLADRAAAASPVEPPELASAPDVAETGDTLEENARIKARAWVEAVGLAAIADDTGLEVDALGGAPGVRAGRYAREGASYAENVAKLLAELGAAGATDPTHPARRTARFVTVALARMPGGTEVVGRGEVEGTIIDAPRGSGGFGYDCVFVPAEGDGSTFAEMTAAEKHALSHRGRAFRTLARALSPRARDVR